MIEFKLTNGSLAFISEEDSDLLNCRWNEFVRPHTTYVRGTPVKCGGQQLLHRLIYGRVIGRDLETHEVVDHIDNNGLNCSRSNLRLATQNQNIANSRRHRNNTSGFKGVSFHKGQGKWNAKIKKNYLLFHLGTYNTPEEAYEAYKKAAIEEYGEFARFD